MRRLILAFLLFNFITSPTQAQFRTKKTISDHAILQRNVEIPITGWGAPQEKVKIILNKKEYPGAADATGKWTIVLPPTKAGGPHTIEIKTADNGLTYKDIYFGDVWLCSGQSNMEWTLRNTFNAEEVIAAANDPLIRQIKVPHLNEDEPVDEVPEMQWEVAEPRTVGDFTAVGYYFAQQLRTSQNVPIGLVNSSWGGSRIEPWISKESLDQNHPDYNFESYTKKHNIDTEAVKAKVQELFGDLTDKDAGLKAGNPVWTGPMESGKWSQIDHGKLWEAQGFEGIDGVAWYRTEFEGRDELVLKLGTIDDNDMTWVNGQLIGETKGYDVPREYSVPASVLKEGKNELLIRVEDTGGGGGMYTTKAATGIGEASLTDFDWYIRFGAVTINSARNDVPNVIYNAMIHPIIDFPLKGVIWYQGESNAGNLKEAYDYRYLLRTLIEDWRKSWKQPDLPFFYVSLANFRASSEKPTNDGWAVIRESMTDVLSVPNTGQAVIIDIGNANDIHPRNKKDVGFRLSLPARNIAYGEDVVPGSPMFASHQVVGNHIIVNFKQVGGGLEVRNKYGYVNGFSIAGEDQVYQWAKAKLEDGKVVVWNESITSPIHVRYAWETNPTDANLFSKEELPITPFRSDDWEVKQ